MGQINGECIVFSAHKKVNWEFFYIEKCGCRGSDKNICQYTLHESLK